MMGAAVLFGFILLVFAFFFLWAEGGPRNAQEYLEETFAPPSELIRNRVRRLRERWGRQ